MKRLVVALVAVALAAPAAAFAGGQRPTLRDLEDEVMCPVCEGQTLDQSRSPNAELVRKFIRRRIAAGRSEDEIKDELVAEFGEGILAAPPARGFGLLAWVIPLAAAGGGAIAVGFLAWRWSRARERDAPADEETDALDRELAWRLDDELARFDG